MDVSCDFLEKQLVCMLLNQTMDVVLKVHYKNRRTTIQGRLYMHSLKYRRWNNQLRPFRLPKKRVANIFRKRTLNSDDSRGTFTQSIINYMERDREKRSVINDIKRSSVHSDWSDLILIDVEVEYWRIYNIRKRPDTRSHTSIVSLASPVAKACFKFHPLLHLILIKQFKNIVLVPYTPKLKEWGSWQVKNSQLPSSTAASQNLVYDEEQEPKQQQQEEEIGQVYQP